MSTTTTDVPAAPLAGGCPTPAQSVIAAAHAVHKLSFAEQVEFLLTSVGPRITAAGAGLRDGRQLLAWRAGELPREGVKRDRVTALAEITRSIMAQYPAAVAASFLRSGQPALEDRAPVTMVRDAAEEDLVEVMAEVRGAVRAFLDG